VSGIQALPRQSSWPALPEQACPLPSHDILGYLQKVVWRLRNFRATVFPLRRIVGSRVGEQFAINMCALMLEEKRVWLGMQENDDGGAKGWVQANPGQARSKS